MTPTSFLFISCPLGIFCMVWTRNPPVSPYWRMSKKWKGIGLWTRLCLLFPMPSGPLRSLSRVGLTSLRMTRTAPSDTKSSHVGEVASVPLSAGAVEARPPPNKIPEQQEQTLMWLFCTDYLNEPKPSRAWKRSPILSNINLIAFASVHKMLLVHFSRFAPNVFLRLIATKAKLCEWNELNEKPQQPKRWVDIQYG